MKTINQTDLCMLMQFTENKLRTCDLSPLKNIVNDLLGVDLEKISIIEFKNYCHKCVESIEQLDEYKIRINNIRMNNYLHE